MERRRVDLLVTDLAIDDNKASYIEVEKKVTPADVREVLGFRPRFFVRQSERGFVYAGLGPNVAGRYLTFAIEPLEGEGNWRLITAYWLRESRGRRLYKEGT
jgi:hypothetical protein